MAKTAAQLDKLATEFLARRGRTWCGDRTSKAKVVRRRTKRTRPAIRVGALAIEVALASAG